MNDPVRWIVAAMVAGLVICLIVWARGLDHHRGDDIGSLGISGIAGP